MAGTTLVITLIEVPSFIQISKQEFGLVWVRTIRLTKSRFISSMLFVGNDIFVLRFEKAVSINFNIQMESNQDFVAMSQQIQALAATVEELTRQNQEMKLRLQQEENQSKGNPKDEGDSHKRSDRQRPTSPNEQNSDLLREMRKEMDELTSAIKEKTDRSLDKLVKATNSPFTTAILECSMPSKFRLPQIKPFDGLKDP